MILAPRANAGTDLAHMTWRAGADLSRLEYSFSDSSNLPGHDSATALEARVFATPRSQDESNLKAGFDLRQSIAANMLSTKLGVRIEYRPSLSPETSLSATWYFGDTFVMRDRSRQYNGDSLSLAIGRDWRSIHVFTEIAFGSYREGAGFIALARAPGDDHAGTRAASVGVLLPL
jgi:hypothetical protein